MDCKTLVQGLSPNATNGGSGPASGDCRTQSPRFAQAPQASPDPDCKRLRRRCDAPRINAAIRCAPSRTDPPREPPGDLRESPTPRATARAACPPPRTPCSHWWCKPLHRRWMPWRCRGHLSGLFVHPKTLNHTPHGADETHGQQHQVSRLNLFTASHLHHLAAWSYCVSKTRSLRGRRRRSVLEERRSQTCENRGQFGSTDKPRVAPWAQEVIPKWTGSSRVAADDLLPRGLLELTRYLFIVFVGREKI